MIPIKTVCSLSSFIRFTKTLTYFILETEWIDFFNRKRQLIYFHPRSIEIQRRCPISKLVSGQECSLVSGIENSRPPLLKRVRNNRICSIAYLDIKLFNLAPSIRTAPDGAIIENFHFHFSVELLRPPDSFISTESLRGHLHYRKTQVRRCQLIASRSERK